MSGINKLERELATQLRNIKKQRESLEDRPNPRTYKQMVQDKTVIPPKS